MQELEAMTMEEYCLLACSQAHEFTYLCYIAQTYLPRNDTTQSGLGPLASIINQEYATTDMPAKQSGGGSSPEKAPLPRVPS